MYEDLIISIPKNASCSIGLIEERIAAPFEQDRYPNVKRFHVILRDPLTRWLSGVIQYGFYRGNYISKYQFPHMPIQDIIRKKVLLEKCKCLPIPGDGHTIPQYTYIHHYIKAKKKLIYYALENPNHMAILNHRLQLFPKQIPKTHISSESDLKKMVGEIFYSQIDETLLERVKIFYKQDYDLYTTNFPKLPLEHNPANYLRRIGCNI